MYSWRWLKKIHTNRFVIIWPLMSPIFSDSYHVDHNYPFNALSQLCFNHVQLTLANRCNIYTIYTWHMLTQLVTNSIYDDNECCFRPWVLTCNAILGRGQNNKYEISLTFENIIRASFVELLYWYTTYNRLPVLCNQVNILLNEYVTCILPIKHDKCYVVTAQQVVVKASMKCCDVPCKR